ncbi:hypothetical protein Droror1_Dr00010938 [Drosera rotundifolia]
MGGSISILRDLVGLRLFSFEISRLKVFRPIKKEEVEFGSCGVVPASLELLELGDRIGYVSTGLLEEEISYGYLVLLVAEHELDIVVAEHELDIQDLKGTAF